MTDTGDKLSFILGAVVFLVVGLALTPAIANQAQFAVGDNAAATNLSSGARALVTLVPLMYVVLIIGGATGFLYFMFKKDF